jgi:hypothetical protein
MEKNLICKLKQDKTSGGNLHGRKRFVVIKGSCKPEVLSQLSTINDKSSFVKVL